jgi:CubicO group peptidase (beta-lactamase class C family)
MSIGNTPLSREITLANWMDPPYNRDAFQRVRELAPTALIARSSGEPASLPVDPININAIAFRAADGSSTTWARSIVNTWCDAVCVVHRGRIVHEQYLNGMHERQPHLLMSVSKSICGALLGIAINRGQFSIDDLVCDVAPEFAGTSLDGATVRHVIDMTAGTDFDEDYDAYAAVSSDEHDPVVPLIEYERHAGYRPLGAATPVGTLGHFRTYGTAYSHGAWFQYRSPLTNIAARLLEVVNGMRYPDIVARDLWTPLGQEHDADIMLDPLGHPVVEGGMSCTLRDLARFGVAYLNDGRANGQQIIPRAWADDTRLGDDAAVAAFASSPASDEESRDWSMYRNAFWVMERGNVFSGLGIFGQYCWIHRPSQTVIARFSTYPTALPFDISAEVLRGFDAVAESLSSGGPAH